MSATRAGASASTGTGRRSVHRGKSTRAPATDAKFGGENLAARRSEFASRLAEMPTEHDWDSYGAHPTTEAALDTAYAIEPVPTVNGGIQVEVHRRGFDLEIEIAPDGGIEGICFTRRDVA